jgi:hypothetical protein
MDIGKWKILAVSLALICSLAIPVLAYTIYKTPLYQFSTGIVLLAPPTPITQLGFYWDSSCTLPVTTIDFGEISYSTSPTHLTKDIWIKNEGDTWIAIYWNSTLGTLTTAITDGWDYVVPVPGGPLNSTTIGEPDTVLATSYWIDIQASPPAGTYNWTLTAWGETWV